MKKPSQNFIGEISENLYSNEKYPRGKRGNFFRISITMPPEIWEALKRKALQRFLDKNGATDMSSLIREACIFYLNSTGDK